MMVRLYDYVLPVADPATGIPNLREALAEVEVADRKALLTGLFKPERMPGSMERLTTLVADVDMSFGDLLTVVDNGARERRFVAIDEAKVILDQHLPPSVVEGVREWDVARLHEPYGDGTYHGRLLKRVRKQLRSVGSREALTTPFLFRREW
jgi:hypothetical protein